MMHLSLTARFMCSPRSTCPSGLGPRQTRDSRTSRGSQTSPTDLADLERRADQCWLTRQLRQARRWAGFRTLVCLGLALLMPVGAIQAYPVLNAESRGIARLVPYQDIELPAGARLPLEQVDLRLTERKDLDLPPPDPELTREIKAVLGQDAGSFSFAVLDLSDPDRPRYAEHRGEAASTAGSVGKLLVSLALFQALAEAWPDDLAARERALRETVVVADGVIERDHHDVPLVDEHGGLVFRPLRQGDAANLWTWLDWMLSASSNAAASMVLKQAMLIKRFGRDYPVSEEQAEAAFNLPESERQEWLRATLVEPVARNGLDPAALQQGRFFTRAGRALAPGFASHATVRELCRFMLRLEQGRLVDEFSSRELKRLLYLTEGRMRYAASPALYNAALYYKSGSLYGCTDEPGFDCRQYHGNRLNLLASVAAVESPARDPQAFYMAAVVSNVLRRDSSALHGELATAIHRIIVSGKTEEPLKATAE